jgi:hypothetical protein
LRNRAAKRTIAAKKGAGAAMIVVRIVGWLLLLAGIIVLGRDVLAWRDTGVMAPVSLEQLWLELGRASLARFEGALAPWALTITRPALSPWAAPFFGVIGFMFAWLGRRRQRPQRRR